MIADDAMKSVHPISSSSDQRGLAQCRKRPSKATLMRNWRLEIDGTLFSDMEHIDSKHGHDVGQIMIRSV